MKLREAFAAALGSLSAHALRSLLATLGVVFGVGAVIAMLSIGAGAESQALEMIRSLGLENVLVRSQEPAEAERREVREKSLGLSLRDSEAILDAVPGVLMVASKVEIEPYSVLADGVVSRAQVFGVAAHYRQLANLDLAQGRFFDSRDEEDHAQVAVVGKALSRRLFGYRSPLGRTLKVDDVWLEVVGVLAAGNEQESFEGVALSSSADAVYLPVTTALRKFDRDPLASPLSEIVIRLEDEEAGPTVARVVDGLLSRLHAGVEDYRLVVPQALLEQNRRTQRLFNIVMGCIAGISLLVGGIGIMNIMLATVLERTREIGIRRAVGAKRKDILIQFVVESFTISLLGGLAGVAFGVLIAKIIAASAQWPTLVEPKAILISVGVAVAVGIASGLYPARRAAMLDPVESLRYD
ncbi:MAG: ABC transporter permease [Acidobacteriota bacterium]